MHIFLPRIGTAEDICNLSMREVVGKAWIGKVSTHPPEAKQYKAGSVQDTE